MKILVTGGAGFLGSHLCDSLIEQGHQVVALDNYYTGYFRNIKHLQNHPHFDLIEHDITQPLNPKEFKNLKDVQQIYNLACPASPLHYQKDPIYTTRTCVLGTLNTLELARELKAPYLQASTSEVYGDPEEHPQKESYWGQVNTAGARSCYNEGKRCAESITFDYHRVHHLPVKVARIFNTYGPRMSANDGRVVSNFIVQILKEKKLTIYGDGQQTRSFCYVSDLVSGLIKLMNSEDSLIGPINLGSPQEFTVQELAKQLSEITDSTHPLIYQPLPSGDPLKRRPDISLAKKNLNWEPLVPLQQGLERTIHYFKELVAIHAG